MTVHVGSLCAATGRWPQHKVQQSHATCMALTRPQKRTFDLYKLSIQPLSYTQEKAPRGMKLRHFVPRRSPGTTQRELLMNFYVTCAWSSDGFQVIIFLMVCCFTAGAFYMIYIYMLCLFYSATQHETCSTFFMSLDKQDAYFTIIWQKC